MIVKKFQGKSEIEALTKAKEELGSSAVIMNVKTIKPRALAKLFKSPIVEVTAAVEETDNNNTTKKVDFVANEKRLCHNVRKIITF